MTKSRAVSPSIGFPFLSLTLTVWTIRWVDVRNVGGGACWASSVASASVRRSMSETQPQRRLQPAHRVGEGGTSELRARDDGVDRGERDAVEYVGRRDAPFEVRSAAEPEHAREARVESELRG